MPLVYRSGNPDFWTVRDWTSCDAGMKGHLQIRCDDDSTVIGYMRDDGHFAAVQIADDSDVETVAGPLRVLAESITREQRDPSDYFNPHRRMIRRR